MQPCPSFDRTKRCAAGNLNDSLAAFDPTYQSPSSFHSASIPDGTFGSPLIQTAGAHNLISPLFSHTEPMVVDMQSLPTGPLTIDHVDDCLWTNADACRSPLFDFGREIDASCTAAPRRGEDLTHQSASLDNRPRKRQKNLKPSSHDASELMVESLSQTVLCEDFYSLLESELPRWTRKGLWHETSHKFTELSSLTTTVAAEKGTPPPPPSSYSKLERAYLAVCQLNSRMGDDAVRNRIALIQLHLEYTEMHQGQRHSSANHRIGSTVGRGHASHAIDRILRNIHEGWKTLDARRRAELRAKFHDRKKYGKRWSQLANALGPGILLICSAKLASAVYVFPNL